MNNIDRAIQLRRWTRVAVDNGDVEAIGRLNKLADAAYLKLRPDQCRAYIDWAKSDHPTLAAYFNSLLQARWQKPP